MNSDWDYVEQLTRKKRRKYKDLLTWRYLTPSADSTMLVLFHMWPATLPRDHETTLMQLTQQLAYSPEWLSCDPRRVPYLLSVMSGQRGCSLSGKYKDYDDKSDFADRKANKLASRSST